MELDPSVRGPFDRDWKSRVVNPHVVTSLDFELRWGVADKLPDDPSAYRRNLEGAQDAVHAMLELFQRDGIGATWATVGALGCSSWDEYHARAPRYPRYEDNRLGFRREWRALDREGRLHFAPDTVAAIAKARGQELASHTFSHIYYREAGCSAEDVAADSRAIATLFREKFGSKPRSLVFPRNQVAYTDILRDLGIAQWRNNPEVFYWDTMRRSEQSRWIRGLRMLDDTLPMKTRRAPSSEMRASYLVRFALPERAWKLHVDRIARDARRLQGGQTLHLWWHPHNMGAEMPRHIRRLEGLMRRVRDAAPPQTRFLSMADSASEVETPAVATLG